MTADFEIGHYIRERVVSRAVLLYTGEGLDDDDDDDYEEEVCEHKHKDTDTDSELSSASMRFKQPSCYF